MSLRQSSGEISMSTCPLVETVQYPKFSQVDFSRANKKPGLSGIVRLKNEAEFARLAIESFLPHFDEIIIVYNDCTDATPEIVADLAARFPARVKAYHYLPRVVPIGSREHLNTPANSVHSFVYNSNFALSKASYQIRCMWAGDQVADPASFGRVVRELRGLRRGTLKWWLSPWGIGSWWFTGINLWQADGQIYVRTPWSIIGGYHDQAFYPAGRFIRYKFYPKGEYPFNRILVHHHVGCVFYHMKGMKQDLGEGKYELERNADSLYIDKAQSWRTKFNLLTIDEFRAREPRARHMPDPQTLGIFPSPKPATASTASPTKFPIGQ